MRFLKARSQLLPIAHKFEVEKFFGLACADEELAVVLDLHKGDALLAEPVLLLSGEEDGLGIGKVHHKEVGVWVVSGMSGCALLRGFHYSPLGNLGTLLESDLCSTLSVVKFGRHSHGEKIPKLFKQAVLLLFAIACA